MIKEINRSNEAERAARGFTVPEGILIQASAFGDRRPTLFAVKKFLLKKFTRPGKTLISRSITSTTTNTSPALPKRRGGVRFQSLSKTL